MQRANLVSRLAGLPLWVQLSIWAILGAVAGLGQAPFGWALVSVVGFAAAFRLLSSHFADQRPAHLGWAFGFGYFLLTLQWLVSPFLVEPEKYGWMAPFALISMSGGLALFWAAAFWLAGRLGRPSALIFAILICKGFLSS